MDDNNPKTMKEKATPQELCSSCDYFGDLSVFTSFVDLDDRGGLQRSSVSLLKQSALECKLCRLKFCAIKPELDVGAAENDNDYQVSSADQQQSGSLRIRPGGKKFPSASQALLQGSRIPPTERPGTLLCDFEWDDLDPESSHLFKGRIMRDIVDPRLLKTWLRMSVGGRAAASPSLPLAHTRFIDVDTNCIIEGTTDIGFVALSYVWGNAAQLCLDRATKDVLTTSGGLERLRARLPRTISDAMAICKAVGERFLWVDALCIQQDDHRDKQGQIAAMGSIYRSASFTIVQGSSSPFTDANSPLPGVQPGTRHVQQTSEVIRGYCNPKHLM
ncbi:heterokaryon incompatibility protein-domain-containing protein [Podospora australis]|uniref:Heterokaryon incompatibility protein-domain-containing protein n=1 Tax=Podospora australis TaxID=1536484 RepID=A0AAN7AI52_9PEZI|nr:heterokaryon incompatibility protein-domain-containing protein [Podospora australis]